MTSIGTSLSAAVGISMSIAAAEGTQKIAVAHSTSIAVTRDRAYRCLILMFLFLPLALDRMVTCG